MKDKIIFLIIGMLIGAIITTGGFFIYNKSLNDNSTKSEDMQMNENEKMQSGPNGEMGTPPEKPDGDSFGEPPSKPDGDNGEEPPEKPTDSNNNVNG